MTSLSVCEKECNRLRGMCESISLSRDAHLLEAERLRVERDKLLVDVDRLERRLATRIKMIEKLNAKVQKLENKVKKTIDTRPLFGAY